ncbi:MAG TPA: ATP-binding protein [Mycobacteriales bacterium]|jgi:anti-sigma regulatory factor (Ser/Thr protein kinase)|nr:ATP-binding protein [Mycobacteriales bacterium]
MSGIAADTDVTVTLRLPPSPAHVRTARLIAAAMARRSGVGEDNLDEVRLAVGEACARAVRMQERQGVTAPVTVEFAEAGRFRVSVVDGAKTGTGDELTAMANGAGGSIPWADPSGDALGLALLGAVVQDLVVDQEIDGGTRVTMSWPLA